jgi:tetratricopeptide (TPR) repeat protein
VKKTVSLLFVACFMLCLPLKSHADVAALVSEADALFKYDNSSMADDKKASEILKQAVKEDPSSFEANWKCARAIRYYAEKAKEANVKGWKDICAKSGKEGMGFAQKAIELNPNKPDGYYYYGVNVGIYSDGVSIFTALKEGLKNKTQSSFEKVVKLDKNYEKCGALISLGRFWSVLPFPMKDKKKSISYFKEYQATPHFGKAPEGVVYYAEVLIDAGGKDNKDEAKKILTDLKTDNPYFKKYAQDLMKKI